MIRTLATGCLMSLAMLAAGYAQAADKVGIAACDDFLTKYETCISSKVPAAQQATFKSQFDQTRKAWSDMAKNASTKPTLEASCKQTMDQMKTALQAYGCSF
jgi:hypothetical protein